MKRKPKKVLPKCERRQRAFIVAQIGSNRLGASAARTREEAIERVMPDDGDVIQLFQVCAHDEIEARFFHALKRSIALPIGGLAGDRRKRR